MKKFIRFAVGGNVGAIVGYGIFILLTELGVWYLVSSIVGEIVLDLTNFSIYKFWAFGERSKKKTKKEIALYTLVALAYWVINTGLLYFFTDQCYLKYWQSKALVIIILAWPSFWATDKVFKKNGEKPDDT